MTTETEILEQAKANEAEALKRLEAASTAVSEAEEKLAALRADLANAEAAERVAAEEGKPVAAHTKRVRDLQDALRVGGYRLDKLKRDAAERQNEYTRAFQLTQDALRAVSRTKLREAADAFEASLQAAADAKRAYLETVEEYARFTDSPDFRSDNVGRIILWAVTTRLLERELYAGRALTNNLPILSAFDIRQQIGAQFSPLIR
jgi:predicted  nucleic acid-binding Zn-ribbon protein